MAVLAVDDSPSFCEPPYSLTSWDPPNLASHVPFFFDRVPLGCLLHALRYHLRFQDRKRSSPSSWSLDNRTHTPGRGVKMLYGYFYRTLTQVVVGPAQCPPLTHSSDWSETGPSDVRAVYRFVSPHKKERREADEAHHLTFFR